MLLAGDGFGPLDHLKVNVEKMMSDSILPVFVQCGQHAKPRKSA